MKTIASLLLIASCTVACNSSSFHGRHRASNLTVNDDILVYVPESERDDIAKARTDLNAMEDRVAIAESNVEQEKKRRDLSQGELRAAEVEVDNAEKALEVARTSAESSREREVQEANRMIEDARARRRAAQSKIWFHDTRIEQLEAAVELTEAQVELAEAKVELAKAEAVHELDRPESRDISVSEFRACVEEREAEVALAEVDAEAWEKKVKLRQDLLDARQKAREASHDTAKE
ncbi:MAG: hypothetical protein ACKVWV_09880 [Planctomycetota bacterium]